MDLDSREGSVKIGIFSEVLSSARTRERERVGGRWRLTCAKLVVVFILPTSLSLMPLFSRHIYTEVWPRLAKCKNMADTQYIEMLVHNYCIRLITALSLCISYKYTYFKEVHTEVSVYYTWDVPFTAYYAATTKTSHFIKIKRNNCTSTSFRPYTAI